MIGAVHVGPALAVPLGLVAAAALAWYWRRLRAAPAPRRRVRRLSVAIMLVTIANLVAGLALLDPLVYARSYVASWTISILLLLMVLVTALVDMLVTWRLQHEATRQELRRAGEELAREVRARREGGAGGRIDGDPEDVAP